MNGPVAIVGFVEIDRAVKDAKAAGGELWAFNDVSTKHGRTSEYSLWFELHKFEKLGDEVSDYAELKCPIYMVDRHPQIPTSLPYPKRAILEYFGVRYFTNSVSWMLALAIYQKRSAISLFGVDMAMTLNEGPDEIGEQRPSIEFFLGWAKGAGIEVVIPEWSDLLKTDVLYGFEDHADSPRLKARIRAEQMRKYAAKYEKEAAYYRGAASAYEATARTWELTDES